MNKTLNSVTVFSSVQWMFFMFANTIVVPVSIGTTFGLPAEEIAMMIRSTLILTGIASILQGWLGHRYPLMEGHSGLWWGVMLNLGLSANSLGMSFTEIGGGIATGIILAGMVAMLLAVCNLVSIVQRIFNPMVISVYLFLLTFQLMFIFFDGMLGKTEKGTLDIPVTLLSMGILILVSFLKIKGNRLISNFSILIGIVIGWLLFAVLFPEQQAQMERTSASFTLFPLGTPNLEFGIILVSFFTGLLNLSNTFASVEAASKLYHDHPEPKQSRNSMLLTGVYSIVSSGFGLVPYTPFTSSIGFLESTRILHLKPFYIGGALLTLIGLIPVLGSFLATMPITIGSAVLLVAYLQLFGSAYSSLNGATFNSNTIFRLAAPVLLGISIMNLPLEMFEGLPVEIQPFLNNGLVMGMLLSIILEKIVKWDKLI